MSGVEMVQIEIDRRVLVDVPMATLEENGITFENLETIEAGELLDIPVIRDQWEQSDAEVGDASTYTKKESVE